MRQLQRLRCKISDDESRQSKKVYAKSHNTFSCTKKRFKRILSVFVAAYAWRFQSYISRLANRQADKDPDKVIATPFPFFPSEARDKYGRVMGSIAGHTRALSPGAGFFSLLPDPLRRRSEASPNSPLGSRYTCVLSAN